MGGSFAMWMIVFVVVISLAISVMSIYIKRLERQIARAEEAVGFLDKRIDIEFASDEEIDKMMMQAHEQLSVQKE